MKKAGSKVYYLKLRKKDFLDKIEKGKEILKSCTLCGNNCKVDRLNGQTGKCGIDSSLWVSSHNLHHGEEPPISGSKGSGTIFMTGCCLQCLFCQNYPISHLKNGKKVSAEKIASMMISLKKRGAHNINFVSPTHQGSQIIEGLYIAAKEGLDIPIVYNSGGYDSIECLKLFDGIVDIYLPDFKYADDKIALKYSGVENYFATASKGLKEMYRQVGNFIADENEVGIKGLLVRHLVLPEEAANTKKVFECIRDNISKEIHASIMGQYFPAYKAPGLNGLKRRLTTEEYQKAIDDVLKLGFHNIYKQDLMLEYH